LLTVILRRQTIKGRKVKPNLIDDDDPEVVTQTRQVSIAAGMFKTAVRAWTMEKTTPMICLPTPTPSESDVLEFVMQRPFRVRPVRQWLLEA